MTPPPITLHSFFWARNTCLALCVAACIAALSVLPAWGWPWAVLLIAGLAYFDWRRITQANTLALRQDSGGIELGMAGRPPVRCRILASSRIYSFLVVLHLRDDAQKKRYKILLWPDSASAEALRQWRVWLRWFSQEAQGKDPKSHNSHDQT